MRKIRKFLYLLALNYVVTRGGVDVVALYEALIIAGRKTLSQVPVQFQGVIKADFAAMGLDENGKPVD